MALADPITDIAGLGLVSAKKLNQFGIYTQTQLLFHLPINYQDKTQLHSLDNPPIGQLALFELTLEKIEKTSYGKKQLLCYLVNDRGKKLLLRFFHWTQFQLSLLTRGHRLQCFGEVLVRQNGLEMVHPEYSNLSLEQTPLLSATLSPIYPNTLGVAPTKLKKWIKQSLELMVVEQMCDTLKVCQTDLPNIMQAIQTLHYPKPQDLLKLKQWQHLAQKRIIFDELCGKNLALLQLKQKKQNQQSAALPIPTQLNSQLSQGLNFELTHAQKRVIKEIQSDLNKPQPMMRLLQGDVGCGKTIVAIFASLSAVNAEYQVAIMAPTEILAKQHFANLSQTLARLNITCALLVSAQTSSERKIQADLTSTGKATLIIGTHALFQEAITFKKLGLVIIDEQHKFGVHQRLTLAQKAQKTPHQLIMTATPIPRSLAMSAYADLDTSIIDELPSNRQPITTIALSKNRKAEVFEKIKQVCTNQQQVYWVCTLVEDSEILPMQSANAALEELSTALPNLKVGLIHGKLKKDQKQQLMQQFVQKKLDILIATTVIEVGVDVPNASLMVVEDAQRLGLAQLHQLRGRVGRGVNKSMCILMYQKPLTSNAKARLEILRQSHDGFDIAQKDLELRGAGEVLGVAQTGDRQYRIANIVRDEKLLELCVQISPCLLKQSKAQQDLLIARWGGDKGIEYGQA